jgi:hypothetical protein
VSGTPTAQVRANPIDEAVGGFQYHVAYFPPASHSKISCAYSAGPYQNDIYDGARSTREPELFFDAKERRDRVDLAIQAHGVGNDIQANAITDGRSFRATPKQEATSA